MTGLPIQTFRAVLFTLLAVLFPEFSNALTEDEREQMNFAFASYLGTGYYTTSEGKVFVLQLPYSYDIRELDLEKGQAGYKLRLPLTVGLVNFDRRLDNDQIPRINDVTTFSVVPGLEYMYPAASNWSLHPFVDYGIAYKFSTNTHARLFGIGIKSFAYFGHGNNTLVLGNRLLYASENRIDVGGSSDYAVFESGLDYLIPTEISIFGHYTRFGLYYLNLYYPDELVFLSDRQSPVELNNANEIGITFSLPQASWLPDDPRLGFGIRYSGEVRFYRIVFGMPFF